MSETTTPAPTPAPLYPQAALSIRASYAGAERTQPAGNPETVDIEFAELPTDVDLPSFVTALVDSLFRYGATDVNHNLPAGMPTVEFCGTTRREAS